MKKLLLVFCLFFFTKNAYAKVTIFACEPEWGSLAKEIVGNKAEVAIGTKGDQNPRIVKVRSGVMNVIRKADMVFCSGDGLEEAWLDDSIKRSYNLKVQAKVNSYFLAADYLKENEKKTDANLRDKDLKNKPRVHLNPNNITKIAEEFTRRIKLIDPVNADFYQKSHKKFSEKWLDAISRWQKIAAPLKGMKIVVHDDSWLDLTNWLGLEIVAKIDTKPGVMASSKHLNDVVKIMKKNPAQAIVFANYEEKKSVLWLSKKTKTRAILLPFTVYGSANSNDLFQMFSTTINLLLADCTKVTCPSMSISNTQENQGQRN